MPSTVNRIRRLVLLSLATALGTIAIIIGISLYPIYRYEYRFNQIQPGMSLAEVQSIMQDSGQEHSRESLPHHSSGTGKSEPAVKGDYFVYWGQYFHLYIIVGFKNDVVVDKYFYSISL